MKIKGYTLHGDYYLADKVITCTNWEEACKMKEVITLPNGKMVVAHILSKEELGTIPRKERGNRSCWYWTSTSDSDMSTWFVSLFGDFGKLDGCFYSGDGGARLGFYKNETKQLLDIE